MSCQVYNKNIVCHEIQLVGSIIVFLNLMRKVLRAQVIENARETKKERERERGLGSHKRSLELTITVGSSDVNPLRLCCLHLPSLCQNLMVPSSVSALLLAQFACFLYWFPSFFFHGLAAFCFGFCKRFGLVGKPFASFALVLLAVQSDIKRSLRAVLLLACLLNFRGFVALLLRAVALQFA